MKILILIAAVLGLQSSAMAESSKDKEKSRSVELGEEANAALYNLSLCARELPQILESGTWIGQTFKRTSGKNFTYNFHIYTWEDIGVTVEVGTLTLSATYRPDPPADGSSYDYECSIQRR